MQPDMFAYTEARQARDAALQTIEANAEEWINLAMIEVENMRLSGIFHSFISEDIRLWLSPRIGRPHTPKVWGALTMKLIRAKKIFATGQWVHMNEKRSHGRQTPQYVWHPLT